MSHDTCTMTLHEDDFSFPGNKEFDWSEEQISFLVDLAVSESDLAIETPMSFRNFGVSEIVKGRSYSKAAYIESGQGYFIISTDMMLHIIVTYSRWD